MDDCEGRCTSIRPTSSGSGPLRAAAVIARPITSSRTRERRRGGRGDRRGAPGKRLTREELADAVVERSARRRVSSSRRAGATTSAMRRRRRALLRPTEGQKVTFVHPDDWLGRSGRGSRPRRCARWRAATPRHTAPSRTASFARGSALASGSAGARELSGARSAGAEPVEPRRAVRLLPEYDVYVMGFRERDAARPA